MTKPYSLTLYSLNKPDTIGGVRASQHMIGYGLWSEFAKLPHVTLRYCNTVAPEADPAVVDFTLIHDCLDSPVYQKLTAVRARTRSRLMVAMEWPYQGPDEELIDNTFTFLPIGWSKTEPVLFPCLRSVLAEHTATEKVKGSILLDHVRAPWVNTDQDWSPRLYEWLKPLAESRRIAQLARYGHEAAQHFPSWVQPIPESFYPDYLNHTSPYETFILTHPGSYEHSILDMTGRGIRVLVPVQDGKPFANQFIILSLNLPTFSTGEELMTLLTQPADVSMIRVDLLTDMSVIVAKIDRYCQENLA